MRPIREMFFGKGRPVKGAGSSAARGADPTAVLEFMGRIGNSCALQSESEAAAATFLAGSLGLESHHDPRKNWDSLKALYHVTCRTDRPAAILDAGASTSSALLKWLSTLGYRNLFGCNLKNKDLERYGVRFSRQDMTRTDYASGFFRAVTCISVIEHIGAPEPFFMEMRRIIGGGGLLLVSTDYWSEPIDTRGIYPYGPDMPEMKVFTPLQMEEVCRLAEASGFRLLSPWEPGTRDRAVKWERVGREYTFAFLALERAG